MVIPAGYLIARSHITMQPIVILSVFGAVSAHNGGWNSGGARFDPEQRGFRWRIRQARSPAYAVLLTACKTARASPPGVEFGIFGIAPVHIEAGGKQ